MDRRHGSFALLAVGLALCAALGGCSNSGGNSAGGAASGGKGNGKSVPLSLTDSPEKATFEFLEAVRIGNVEQVSLMLTELAREKASEQNLVVSPPGSDTAKFQIGEVEYVGEDRDGARVASKWSDVYEKDKPPRTDDIVWFLRRGTQGWRIAGMATKVFEDAPALILNFEDPEDMIRKKQLAEVEMTRRATEKSQAQKPDPLKKIN